MKPDYTLYYWPVPFRGHFIRAILTYACANWTEGGNVPALMQTPDLEKIVPFMGPPVLIDHTADDFATSQMPAIALYLGEKFKLVGDMPQKKTRALKIILDANDLIDELTLQGGMEMWTPEKWQEFMPRLKRWMSFWEIELARAGGKNMLGTSNLTIADIVTATLFGTLTERFDSLRQILETTAPNTSNLIQSIWTHELADFAEKSRQTYGDTYCGGQIEQSLRKVLRQK